MTLTQTQKNGAILALRAGALASPELTEDLCRSICGAFARHGLEIEPELAGELTIALTTEFA